MHLTEEPHNCYPIRGASSDNNTNNKQFKGKHYEQKTGNGHTSKL